MKHQFVIAFTTVCLFTTVNSAHADVPTLPLEQQVEVIATRLEGVMSTAAQSSANPKAPNVRMTTCRVTLIAVNEVLPSKTIVLYQEQALDKELAKPYRQRFLQLSASPTSQSVRSRSFKPASSTAWVNFCNKPTADRSVQPRDIGTAVCSVFLRRSGDDYVGNTPVDGCPANVRGAVKIKNHIVLHPDGMDTWDRGFDAAGKQVWGAKAESYQFRREL
jgi:hypothetical protein